MPSVFTLDGPRLGAIAIPLNRGRGGYPEYGGRGQLLGECLTTEQLRVRQPLISSLGAATLVGWSEVSDTAKSGLLAVGTMAAIGLVFWAGTRKKTLRGARRRRRRR